MIKDCTRGIVLLKLTTEKHKASCGLYVTAELLAAVAVMAARRPLKT